MKAFFVPCLIVLLQLPMMAIADVTGQRAKFNYQMFCQGCHTEDGSGNKSVLGLKGFMGHFLQNQEGREYLVRVPGSANSVLKDGQLTEVLNWMLVNFAGESLQQDWRPLDVEEVTKYRKDPLFEVIEHRKKLVQNLNMSGAALAP